MREKIEIEKKIEQIHFLRHEAFLSFFFCAVCTIAQVAKFRFVKKRDENMEKRKKIFEKMNKIRIIVSWFLLSCFMHIKRKYIKEICSVGHEISSHFLDGVFFFVSACLFVKFYKWLSKQK
jgi:hypothetical protein